MRELVEAVAAAHPEDAFELYAHRLRRPEGAAPAAELPPNATLHRRRLPARALALAARAGLGADRVLGSVDVMHWTDYVPLETSRAPVVATVHDVCFASLPDCYTDAQRTGLTEVTRTIAAQAARIIVPCARVRAELTQHFAVEADRIDVVPHGCRPLPDVPPADDLGRYLLFVGTLQPRKNIERLIDAFDAVHADRPDVSLVVAGGRGWLDDGIVAAMAQRAHVTHAGDVDAERLSALYRGAIAVAFPSLGEGFGLPVLEAMHCERAVLVGADTACGDLAGDAALAVDPTSVEAIAEGLRRLVADVDLRATLAARGAAVAAPYTWERTAKMTRAVYAKAVSS